MSRKVRFGALIGLVVVVLIVIGVLVWPTPKDAMAVTQYHITIYTGNPPNNWTYTGGVDVRFSFNPEGDFDRTTNESGGVASCNLEAPSLNDWTARVLDQFDHVYSDAAGLIELPNQSVVVDNLITSVSLYCENE